MFGRDDSSGQNGEPFVFDLGNATESFLPTRASKLYPSKLTDGRNCRFTNSSAAPISKKMRDAASGLSEGNIRVVEFARIPFGGEFAWEFW